MRAARPTDATASPRPSGADVLRQRLISGLGHDLKSPLAAICGFAALLLDDWDELPDRTRRSHVASIERQSRRLRRLVDELDVLARLEAEEVAPDRRPVPVAAAVQETARDYGLAIDAVTCPADLAVLADPDHLVRMLANYLTNAAKYGDGPIVVTADASAGGVVTVEVRDHGPGVPDDFVQELFDGYTRATSSQEGSGLGLWIVRSLAEANGGAALYRPADGGGARFILELPRDTSRDADA